MSQPARPIDQSEPPGPPINPAMGVLPTYPFPRLRALIAGHDPGKPEIDVSFGEPKHAIAPLALETLAANTATWNKYPPPRGTPDLWASCAGWLNRRFDIAPGLIDPTRNIMPLSGTKEGLFGCGLLLGGQGAGSPRPLAAMPNPCYPVYEGAARFGGLEPVYLEPADPQQGVLDPDSLDPAMLDRLTVLFLCNPSNPQGGVLGQEGLAKLIYLARRHGFVLVSDECYAELYYGDPPPSALEVCDGRLDNLLVYHSLSKRSNAAGLRGGFVAGDARLIDAMGSMRSYSAAGLPLPIQAAAGALWDDDTHAAENRARYAEKYATVASVFGNKLSFHQPDGGFFLWLDISGTAHPDSEAAALTLWKEQGVRILPGAYLAHTDPGQTHPASRFVRAALVHPNDAIAEMCERLVEGLIR